MNFIYVLLALLISFLWGIQPVIHKFLLEQISCITILILGGLIFSVGIVAAAIYDRKTIYNDLKKINRKLLMVIFLTSIFCTIFTTFLYYYLLKRNNSAFISALVYSCPIFSLLAAYFYLKEEINIYGIFGIIFITCGVVLVSLNNNTNIANETASSLSGVKK